MSELLYVMLNVFVPALALSFVLVVGGTALVFRHEIALAWRTYKAEKNLLKKQAELFDK